MWAEWSVAQIALVVSFVALLVSIGNLVWNVLSKFIFPKPRLRVWVDLVMYHAATGHSASVRPSGAIAGDFPKDEMSLPAIAMKVTNYGPGSAQITMGVGRLPFLHTRRKEGHGLLVAYENYPEDLSANSTGSGGLPKKLDVGEEWILHYPADKMLLNKKEISAFGVRDSFSRVAWASRQNMRRLRGQSHGLDWNKLP